MKWLVVTVCLLPVSGAIARTTTLPFENMRAKYRGDGIMTVKPVADNTWQITITGMGTTTDKNSLVIAPVNKNRNTVAINAIIGDGSFGTISVRFPPGQECAGYVRNISVNGSVKTLTITGGDLGAGDGLDGVVSIGGYVKTLTVKGRKYNVPYTKLTEYWGGNVWADLMVRQHLRKCVVKGGNLFYDTAGGVLGSLTSIGPVKLISVAGATVVTNRGDSASKVFTGGAINANITASGYPVGTIKANGAAITAGSIVCQSLKQLAVLGRKPPGPFYLDEQRQGVFNVLLQTPESPLSYLDCGIRTISAKNASVRDTLVSAKGTISTIKTTGDAMPGVGMISNAVFRAGFVGSLSQNTAPAIIPATYVTSTAARIPLVIPFVATSGNTNETLTVYLRNRGMALNSFISNHAGAVFSGTNRWMGHSPMSGMFVWTSADYNQGSNSNITVRVRDDGTPNLSADLTMIVSVWSSNVAPQLTLTPSNTTRIVSLMDTNQVSWTAEVFDLNPDDTISFSIENNTLGLVFTNITPRSYFVWSTSLPAGIHSNITFIAADNYGLSDSKKVTVTVTTNKAPVVTTSLATNVFTWAAGAALSFHVIATDETNTTLTFTRPSTLPAAAVYSNATYAGVTVASNQFSWTPAGTNTGVFTWTFDASDEDAVPLTGAVTVVVTVTNGAFAVAAPAEWSDWLEALDPVGAYPGNIARVGCAGLMRDSQFISGVQETGGDWQYASYFGRITKLKAQGAVVSNLFVSGKKIAIYQGTLFDFTNNAVWINGHRAVDSMQH